MSTERDVNRVLRAWLHEDRHEDAERVLNTVLDQLDTTPQRRLSWAARRFPIMNNALRVGLVAAAVVIIAVIAINLLPGSPAPGGGPSPSPSDAASPTPEATTPPGPTAYELSLPDQSEGHATLTLPAGWLGYDWYVQKHDLHLAVWPAPIDNVYGDPCQWHGSLPDPPVGPTVDDLATALANQPTRNATVEDATLDGYDGKVVHMSVPADIDFADCDDGVFASWSEADSDVPARYHQGPGQVDDVYILDVDGLRVIVGASWFPSSGAADVAELEGILSSIDIQP